MLEDGDTINVSQDGGWHVDVSQRTGWDVYVKTKTFVNLPVKTPFTINLSQVEYCKVGDVVGIKGRVQTRMIEKEDGTKYKKVEIIAERVTFLSSKKDSDISLEEESVEPMPKKSSKKEK